MAIQEATAEPRTKQVACKTQDIQKRPPTCNATASFNPANNLAVASCAPQRRFTSSAASIEGALNAIDRVVARGRNRETCERETALKPQDQPTIMKTKGFWPIRQRTRAVHGYKCVPGTLWCQLLLGSTGLCAHRGSLGCGFLCRSLCSGSLFCCCLGGRAFFSQHFFGHCLLRC